MITNPAPPADNTARTNSDMLSHLNIFANHCGGMNRGSIWVSRVGGEQFTNPGIGEIRICYKNPVTREIVSLILRQ